MIFDQAEFDIRCEWGEDGIAALAPVSDAIIIVDIMSFTTCVSVATARGATVFPYQYADRSAAAFAKKVSAKLAGPRSGSAYSLSPLSLLQIPKGEKLVLPSPNGSTLSLATGATPTFVGCFRNARLVAEAAMCVGRRISIIPAGERWAQSGTMRIAIEDLFGAGAIIDYLHGTRSPEAQLAVDTFQNAKSDLASRVRQCSSGKELIARGFDRDIEVILQFDVDRCAPVLKEGAYRA